MGTSFKSCPPILPNEVCCPVPDQHLEVLLTSPTYSAGSCPPMTPWAVMGQAWTTSCVRSHSQPSTGSSHVPMVRDPAPPSMTVLTPSHASLLSRPVPQILPLGDHLTPSFLCHPWFWSSPAYNPPSFSSREEVHLWDQVQVLPPRAAKPPPALRG